MIYMNVNVVKNCIINTLCFDLSRRESLWKLHGLIKGKGFFKQRHIIN